MKLGVTLALICALFSKAPALRCYQCMPQLFGDCTDTQTYCPHQCDSKTIVLNFGDQKHEIHSKTCAIAEQCVTGSLNLGHMKMTFNTKCCSTDLCNSQKVTALPQGSPNGKICYACSKDGCSETVRCEGDEDRCISTTVNSGGVKMTMRGCVSRSLCVGDTTNIEEAGITGDVRCCEGNLCNRAAGVKLSLLIMLVSLLSSILFF
ncbi:urokinase plasminogen activator surface receptor-like [Pygocentrus nattereri]|uniref:UPAR/Ly6 domain-containing protein n=1 Tax=Pygocentrus nattereri TaxID=42514 RepID=A0A3B4BKF6_PYGNA|nr:urokinase plasminogen activator surface receptor-like [Pygocentrus nattereri]